MLKLNGVSKAYISQDKQRVDALRGVSFELPNTGMVFVLGKSGSGKSTLLNLLGGLDAPTEGEIVVDGVSMKNFKQTDYDSYRNSYVGFVFQEYNLLDSLNVKENVELALQLSKGANIDEKVLSALTQVELSADYLTRRVGELSGGEKQRIAIARSIVKDSKLILADEPTGNLDSATGESIWNILKNLSQTKLVVVVSHDRESAEKYADRIIEISDGEIISDSCARPIVTQPQSRFTADKKRLPFAVCLRMALNSLLRRKAKAISAVVISVLSAFAIVVVQMLLFFSPFDAKVSFVEQHNVPYVTVDSFDHRSFNYIAENSEYIANGFVENKQQVLDFGLTFLDEAQELDSDSFYIRLDTLRYICQMGSDVNYVLIDGKKLYIDEYVESCGGSYESLVGHQVHLGRIDGIINIAINFGKDNFCVLAGIIDTDAVSEFVTRSRYLNYIPMFFVTKEFKYLDLNLERIKSDSAENLVLSLGGNNIFDDIWIYNQEGILDKLITAQGLVEDPQSEGFVISDDEIVVSYELYAKIFDDAKSDSYYVDFRKFNELKNMPEHMGETVEFKFLDGDGNVLLDLGRYKLVGVSFNLHGYFAMNINENAVRQLAFDLTLPRGTILIKTDSVKSLGSFLKTLEEDYNTPLTNCGNILIGGTPNTVNHAVESFDSAIHTMTIIFSVFGGVFVVVLLLLVVNIISFSITSRKREIGILSALGTTQRDVTNIFVFETLIMSVASFVLTLIFLFALIVPTNMLLYTAIDPYIPFLNISWFTIAIVLVATFALPLLAACLPILKLSKLKPVDAIRES